MFLLFSLKLECEKLAGEKTEMQRHYVMVNSYFIFVNDSNLLPSRMFLTVYCVGLMCARSFAVVAL